jgi:hypothetical protein
MYFLLDQKVPKNQGLASQRPIIGSQPKKFDDGKFFLTVTSPDGYPACEA